MKPDKDPINAMTARYKTVIIAYNDENGCLQRVTGTLYSTNIIYTDHKGIIHTVDLSNCVIGDTLPDCIVDTGCKIPDTCIRCNDCAVKALKNRSYEGT